LQFQFKAIEGGSYDNIVADQTGSAASHLLFNNEGEQAEQKDIKLSHSSERKGELGSYLLSVYAWKNIHRVTADTTPYCFPCS
jgi:hypothetical protein